MAKCAACGRPGIAYARVFRGRKKVGSYPVCADHAAASYVFRVFAQDYLRTSLSTVFGIKKGSLPRVEISLTP